MIALGINSVYHESAAAIVVDGRLVAAVEEERFNRRKHGKPARVDNADEVPTAAIDYCLRAAGVRASQIDAIGYSFDPEVRAQKFVCDPLSNRGDWGDRDGERVFQDSLARVPAALSTALGEDVRTRCGFVPHHVAHAASVFFPSGCEEAAILVVDGIGEHATTMLASGASRRIQPIDELYFPHSVGFLWEKISRFLGFSEYDACKVMGLAAYGDASRFRPAFERFVCLDRDAFALDPDVLEFRLDRFERLEDQLGARRQPGERLTARHADVAAALQACTDDIMQRLVARLYRRCPGDNLCLAGGVALNCTTNWRLKEQGPFTDLHIPPAPHDAGTALGAAFAVSRLESNGWRPVPQPSPYLGPEYSDAEIEQSLGRAGLPIRRSNDVAADAAACLARSEIVGWFQGRLEFGPRALGNRSLLADPRRLENRTRLNRSVKRRESFRPFAPSVLAERLTEWFDTGRPSAGYRYMLFACPVRPEKAERIPAVVHQDGTARIHVVEFAANPRFHALIRRFEERTGVPLVLNTSFNDSEPIVCSPDDAIRTFVATDIDVLILGDYVVRSSDARKG